MKTIVQKVALSENIEIRLITGHPCATFTRFKIFGKTSWVDDIGPEMNESFSEVFSLFWHPITLGFEGSTKT